MPGHHRRPEVLLMPAPVREAMHDAAYAPLAEAGDGDGDAAATAPVLRPIFVVSRWLNEKLPPPVNEEDVWASFFKETITVGRECLDRLWLRPEDVIDSEPFLFYGLPALVLLHSVARSAAATDAGSQTIVLADGARVFSGSRPRSVFARHVWDNAQNMKAAARTLRTTRPRRCARAMAVAPKRWRAPRLPIESSTLLRV
jgi:hypothetical protein